MLIWQFISCVFSWQIYTNNPMTFQFNSMFYSDVVQTKTLLKRLDQDWDLIKNSAIFVKPQQWPTPSESIAIYCVRKLVSCITHLQSCAKVDIWNKKKILRTVAKIKTQGYKNWRLPKFSTNVTPPLNTAFLRLEIWAWDSRFQNLQILPK